jgi:hypothetical protein
VADELWRHTAITCHRTIYGCSAKRAGLLTDAIAKVYENQHALLAAAKKGQLA